jgi:hypothetical protein
LGGFAVKIAVSSFSRLIAAGLILVFSLSFFTVYNVDLSAVSAQSEGYWLLVEREAICPPNRTAGDESRTYNYEFQCSDGSFAVQIYTRIYDSIHDVYNEEFKNFSGTWSAPPEKIKPDERIDLTLTATIDQFNRFETNFSGIWIKAYFGSENTIFGRLGRGDGDLTTPDDKVVAEAVVADGEIKQQTETITVSGTAPAGGSQGSRIILNVVANGDNNAGGYRYHYEWQQATVETTGVSTTAPTAPTESEKAIWLEGVVVSAGREFMPRMKLVIEVYLNADSYGAGVAPDQLVETVTDSQGRFSVEVIVPAGHAGEVGLLVKGSLNCILPGNNLTFYLANIKESASQNEITVASYIRVNPGDSQYESEYLIRITRYFSYYYLCAGAWSYDPVSGTTDPIRSNLSSLYDLAAASNTYRLVWDAQLLGAVIFGEVDPLKNSTLRIETHWVSSGAAGAANVSHFSPAASGDSVDGTIRLESSDSRMDDVSRFVVLHEYGHYFDYITNGGMFRTISSRTAGAVNINHGGYMNDSTSDSYLEGFATAFACMVQHFRGEPNPHIAGHFNIGQAGNYVSWKSLGKFEELAVSGLLYNLYLKFPVKQDFWDIVDPDRANFHEYYLAMESALQTDADKLELLRKFAREGGLFQMPFGSFSYQIGEPFRDFNQNGVKDPNENLYGDLMYAATAHGWIDENTTLRDLPARLELGKSSDALRDRQTISLLPNSYLQFDNLPVDDVIIRIMPDGEDPYQILVPVENNWVYLGLVSRGQTGRVEVALPGGDIIFSSDLSALQQRLLQTEGQDVPLAVVSVTDQALATDSGDWALPGLGVVGADELFELPSAAQIAELNQLAAELAEDTDISIGLEQLAAMQRKTDRETENKPENENDFENPDQNGSPGLVYVVLMILLSFLLVVLVIWLIIVLFRNRRRS